MQIIIKKLQGGECALEVLPATRVIEIKRLVSRKLHIPVDQQKLLLLGRPLADDQTVQSYPTIKEGTKLNLVVMKPEGLFETSVKYFKQTGMSDTEAANTANRFMKVVQEKFNKLSWDDIDRLCLDMLMQETGSTRPPPAEVDVDDELYNM